MHLKLFFAQILLFKKCHHQLSLLLISNLVTSHPFQVSFTFPSSSFPSIVGNAPETSNWRAHSILFNPRMPFIFRFFLVPHIFFFFLLLLFSHCRPPSSPSFVISSFVFALRHLVLAYFPPSFRFQAVLFLFLSSSLGFHIISPSPPPPLCPPWPIILTPTHSSDTRLPYTGCPFVFRLNCV